MGGLDDLPPSVRAVGLACGLGFGGSGLAVALTTLFTTLLSLSPHPVTATPVVRVGGVLLVTHGAFICVAAGYLTHRSQPLSFAKLRWPSSTDIRMVVLGIGGIIGMNHLLVLVTEFIDVAPAANSLTTLLQQSPRLIVVLLPAAFLVIAPGEELLYRGVIQARLREVLSPPLAIGGASAIFAGAHLIAILGHPVVNQLVHLAVLFPIALVLALVYEYSQSLVAPILVHGMFNALSFLSSYSTSVTIPG